MRNPEVPVHRPVLPSLPLALLLSPLAASVVAFVVATAFAVPYRFGLGPWRFQLGAESFSNRLSGTLAIGFLAAFGAFIVGAAYTAILGGLAVRRHRKTGKSPSLPIVLVGGLIAGIFPFACFPLMLGVPSEFTSPSGAGAKWAVALFLAVAATAALAASWTFYRLGLKGRA
jgi:hypothetical protein